MVSSLSRRVINHFFADFALRGFHVSPVLNCNKLHKSTAVLVAVANPPKLALYFDVELELPAKSFGRTRHVASTYWIKQRGQRPEHTVLLRFAKGPADARR
jgi:hypothetical protein